jgi:hypothetical protein
MLQNAQTHQRRNADLRRKREFISYAGAMQTFAGGTWIKPICQFLAR